MIKKALIFGSGFLGTEVLNELNVRGIDAVGTYFKQIKNNQQNVDIRNFNSVNDCVLKIKPDLIVNCSANVQIDFLEKNPKIAFSINADGPKNIAMVAKKNQIKLIHISTDSVFDGKKEFYSENDIPNPINVYSKSKLMGEQNIEKYSEDYIIIRTNFYGYDPGGKFLFNWILNELKNKKHITGFSDIIFTPLEISNLSKMISDISKTKFSGIIHLASDDVINKYQFALKIAEVFDFDKKLIKKGSIEDFSFIAKRPKNTSLSNKKSKKIMDTKIISLNDWLTQIKKTIF